MYHFLYVTTAFFTLVACDKYGLIHFSQNKTELAKCIEDHFKLFRHFEDHGLRKIIFEEVAKEFHSQTVTMHDINFELPEVVLGLSCLAFFELVNNQLLLTQLQEALKKALLDCSDPIDESRFGNTTYSRLNRQTLPNFVDEEPGIRRFLDLMLVNWPYPLKSMIQTQKRRDVLRKYAEDALQSLKSVYSKNVEDSSFFWPINLRNTWRRRAELFYDARNIGKPYIDHIYTTSDPFPHTHGDVSMFVNLSNESFRHRNPRVPEGDVQKILNIHAIDRSNRSLYDYYVYYLARGMDSSEYYYEDHRNQFYRVLFFFLELEERSIDIPEEEEPINVYRIPAELQEILYDDNVYRDYLLARKYLEVSLSYSENVFRRNLIESTRVREEDLIMLFLLRIRSAKSTRSFSSTTYSTIISTTHKYEESKKGKGSVFKGPSGKCFPTNRQKSANSCQERKKESSGNSKSSHESMENIDKSYGYFTNTDDFDQSLFIKISSCSSAQFSLFQIAQRSF